ncbi:MAG: AraC family transcriptional regulator [Clostridia bacterium]|nr:AraC family transcriptional regulator [Clostridia bacterium]
MKQNTLPEHTDSYCITNPRGEILFRYNDLEFIDDTGGTGNYVYPRMKIAVVSAEEADWCLGQTTIHISPGDVVILRPGTVRHFENYPEGGNIVLDIYEFTPDFLNNSACTELFMTESTVENTVLRRGSPYNSAIREYLGRVKDEMKLADSSSANMVRGLLTCALMSVCRAFGVGFGTERIEPYDKSADNDSVFSFELCGAPARSVPAAGDHSFAIVYVLNLIRTQISGEISVSELAASAHMSRSHFYKIFRKYTGMSVNDFILKCRVDNTVRLLTETDCNILDAAYASGFTSSSGFYKSFRKITGCTPKEYVKNLKKGWKPT